VLIVHGLGEHIGRYAWLATHLGEQGWQVWGYDQRGHGASGGQRGALDRDDDLLRDLARVIDTLGDAGAPAPLVLLGHSMGGTVAGRFVAEGLEPVPAPWYRSVDALALSSPALDAGIKPAQEALLSVLAPALPNLPLPNGLKREWISRDAAVVRAYEADPLVHDRLTPRLARFIVEGGAFVRRRAHLWRVPTLLMWAGADRCVAPRGSAQFAAAAPSAWVQARAWPMLAHEIFNEPERTEVVAELARWLRSRGH
jgi:alpha-beta hydrolase superfamily lysophospholipase